MRLDGRCCVVSAMLLGVFGCGEAEIDSGSGGRGGAGEGESGVVGQYGEAATQDPIAGIGGVDEECQWDGSCNEGLVCLGTCQYASEFPGVVGGPCFEDSTCQGALECRDGTCADVDALEAYFNKLTLEDPGELFGDDALLSTRQGLEVAADLDLSTVGQLPGSVTLTRYLPPVGNQGSQGSCVSWAMGYGLASYMIGVRNQNPPDRTDELMSPAYLHNQTVNYRDCHSGPPGFNPSREILHGQGIVPLSVMVYSTSRQGCTQQVTQQMRSAASQNKLREVYHLNKMNTLVRSPSPPTRDVLSDGDLNQIKTLLSRGYPVAIAIRTYAEFMRMGRNGVQSTMTPRQDTNLGHNYHAILAIGYDDARQTILVRNSWGSSWGNRGTAEISYNVFKKITGIAYAGIARDMPTQSTPEPSPQLPTTPASTPSSFACDSVTLGRSVPQNTCIQIDSARSCRWFRCAAPNEYTEMSPSNLSGCAQQFAHQSCSGSPMPDPMPDPMPEPSTRRWAGHTH